MSDLTEQIDALLALNAKGAVSHPVPGLAVELLTKAAEALRATPVPAPVPLPVTITDAARERAAQAIYERGPSIGDDTEDGWSAQSNDYKRKAREIADVALSALSANPGERG